jgi:hypothetical protein
MMPTAAGESPRIRWADHLTAWLVVLLGHLAFGAWLIRVQSVPAHLADPERMSIHFVLATQKRIAEVTAPSHGGESGSRPSHRLSRNAHPATKAGLPMPADPGHWPPATDAPVLEAAPSAGAAAAMAEPPIFKGTSSRIFAESPQAARFRPAPERFKVRTKITTELIVREFGRLAGLWPPGYTDDPCPGINRAIEEGKSMGVASDAERRLLADAAMVHQRFCR